MRGGAVHVGEVSGGPFGRAQYVVSPGGTAGSGHPVAPGRTVTFGHPVLGGTSAKTRLGSGFANGNPKDRQSAVS